jgi:hypothetical protein
VWLKSPCLAGHQWYTPVILATQDAEFRRMVVRSKPQANSLRDPNSKIPNILKKELVEWLEW